MYIYLHKQNAFITVKVIQCLVILVTS